ncbi:MAG: neutral zinc metallopeptidase, partial [Burkholderiales bacterium]|nr:neutral zinc metallopeptidase [Burkholderiales bacterium]
MRLDPLQQSNDVEDRRGSSGGIMGGGAGRIGIGGMILAAVAYFVFGINPSTTLSTVSAVNSMTGGGAASSTGTKGLRTSDEQAVFASKIFQSTKDVWSQTFGGQYRAP